LWIACCAFSSIAAAQDQEPPPDNAAAPAATPVPEYSVAPVMLDGRELFMVRGVAAYPADKRAAEIAEKIEQLAADLTISPDSVRMEELPDHIAILSGEVLILNVYQEDAELEKISEQLYARALIARIRETITLYREDRSTPNLAISSLYAFGATLLLLLAAYFAHRLLAWLNRALERRCKSMLDASKLDTLKLVKPEQIWTLLSRFITAIKLLVWVVLIYVYIEVVTGLFPWTRGLGNLLLEVFIEPLRIMGAGIVAALPDLVFLVVLFFITRFLLKITRLFFAGLAQGSIRISGFDREWSLPTYRLLRLFVIVLALVIAYPYIPGSSSEAFKAISIFLGVVFSLGSSSFISNIIAGHTMAYRRAFRVGDRIRIGDQLGDVTVVRLLETHLRTVKNEEIIIPNSIVLNSNIINYSSLAQQQGLILHTTVGIGYEVPWRQVHALLLAAAERTEGLLREPPAFVLQKQLGDFAVTYELNVYCDDARHSPQLYDRLHQNIQDLFNEYGVQIMTPAYERDTPEPKVVPKERWYAEPAKPPPPPPEGE